MPKKKQVGREIHMKLNYKKEDVTNRKKNTAMKEEKANKKIDVDSVRQKAYGTLVDDIEDTLFDSHDLFFAETQEKDVLPEVELLQDFDVLEDAPKREDNFSDFGVEYRKEEINIEAFRGNCEYRRGTGKSF